MWIANALWSTVFVHGPYSYIYIYVYVCIYIHIPYCVYMYIYTCISGSNYHPLTIEGSTRV